MKKAKKAAIEVVTMILANVSAISIGIALFEQKWWAFSVAIIAAIYAVALAWRKEL